MKAFDHISDTIAAISSSTGQGGIGLLRISGQESLSIAGKIFKPRRSKNITESNSYTVHYGWIVEPGNPQRIIDEVLLTIMRSPKSYTTEDVVEISCHGGSVALRSVLSLILEQGARLAEPGEFTKRAFLHGRIDLTQAEAVLDIIQSRTNRFLQISSNQLKGELSTALSSIREVLMHTYVTLEALINFPEDEIDGQTQRNIEAEIKQSLERISLLLTASEQGRILKEGIKIVLCGKPNVGKSSLLNVLLKQDRAIVSEIAGTTRDTIEESAQIKGIPFQIVDTAGILKPRNSIEEEAVKRSHMYIRSADVVLFLFDWSRPFDEEDSTIIRQIENEQIILVFNKQDLPKQLDTQMVCERFPHARQISLSALSGNGVASLEDAIAETVWHGGEPQSNTIMISNLRQINALKRAFESVGQAKILLENQTSFEFVSEEIKQAVHFLDQITGKDIDADLLDTIFSQFCIGK
ncbi:MAG: tRNA uridine-5-carboxymethylaminomethyl(34) synthesis GTPase MnmE [Candidatus Omnitrophica bacterium]|nr:tRNA uridine-5-carboxymethylaminomethyl(34) synthesis GTPase MnmE [Candidatus Omnitrophota bacterium]